MNRITNTVNVAHIHLGDDGIAPGSRDLGGERFKRLPITGCNRHPGTGIGKRPRQIGADPLASSGHECHLSIKPIRWMLHPVSVPHPKRIDFDSGENCSWIGSMSETRAITAVVTGRVQGVGFRYSTQRMASQLGLDGWVRNQYDGSVELHAQGDKDVVSRFLGFLEEGPPAARVVNLHVAEAPIDPSLRGFGVRY